LNASFLFDWQLQVEGGQYWMITLIDELPSQLCFERDGYIFCNWVYYPKRKGYAIVSATGKFLRFIEKNKSEQKEEKKL